MYLKIQNCRKIIKYVIANEEIWVGLFLQLTFCKMNKRERRIPFLKKKCSFCNINVVNKNLRHTTDIQWYEWTVLMGGGK